MNMRIQSTATCAVTLLLAFASRNAFAGIPQTAAIAVDTNSLAAKTAVEAQDGMVTRIVSGLAEVMSSRAATDISLTPVGEAKMLEQVLDCEGTECLQDLANSAKVDLVIQVRVHPKQAPAKASKRARQDFRISMIVVRSGPDRDAWSEKTDCQACGASEIKHTASLLASLIAERISVKPVPSEPAHQAVPAPIPIAVAPPQQPRATPLPSSAPARWTVPTYLSVTALAGGLILTGTGLYLMHIDGRGTCALAANQELCPRRYKTQGLGIGLLVGGELAALSGLAGLIFFSPGVSSTHMALNITGSSISVSGGF